MVMTSSASSPPTAISVTVKNSGSKKAQCFTVIIVATAVAITSWKTIKKERRRNSDCGVNLHLRKKILRSVRPVKVFEKVAQDKKVAQLGAKR